MATTTLVELGGASAHVAVARALVDEGFASEVEKLAPSDAAIAIADACKRLSGDVEGRQSLLRASWSSACALVAKCPHADEAEVARRLSSCAVEVADSDDTVTRSEAVRAIVSLFNACIGYQVKADVLLALLRAANARQDLEADRIAQSCASRVLQWTCQWDLGEAKTTQILEMCIALQQKREDSAAGRKDARRLRQARLEYGGAVNTEIHAQDAVADFLTDEHAYQTSLLECGVVQHLQSSKDKTSRLLYSLLVAVISGNVQETSQIAPEVQLKLQQFGGSADGCTSKARLLAIAALGGDTVVEVPYEKVSEVLNVEVEDVEKWVVEAVGHQVTDAKLDQLRQLVVISMASKGIFGIEQWRSLRERLGSWRDTVAAMNKSVGESKGVPFPLAA